ncbi:MULTISPECIES: acetylglutamate kinase [Pelosinus]|uniref:Acetylglutamate kinase n=1 Tax=Pelosinus fermentans B4 TaxID=1149862 RepID=I9L8B0_9FIRM|nr:MULTISPECIES: acetylglutamate kinase [Pelosinus]EIW16501.1 acetylglutamate kinase [Pelosinus fermentans B4]EIW22518.1 acetylglutamate kinase [Pelosinus fermentans A11]OAM95808.1 Acetylglutamate kinase [Pelosinus fermentans DSM 17108]SDR33036.1 N-acetylglutamate kinase [Pelosinus fermentans]
MKNSLETAAVLIETLPYMQDFYGKTVVIKYGGNAMINSELKNSVIQDITLLKYVGMRPIVVHGGGPEITSVLNKFGKKTEFISGLRVTDEETVSIAEMVLVGKINTEIVNLLNRHGSKAVGLSGKDANLILAKKHFAEVHENGRVSMVDIGFVGEVESINTNILNTLIDSGYIPVIAPIGVGKNGESYNINADYVAGEVAGALGAEKLIMLTDVEGIYRDYQDKTSFISSLSLEEAQQMIAQGSIGGGMIPKVETCIKALQGGTGKTHIIDGRQPHSILLEIFTSQGIGTQVVK